MKLLIGVFGGLTFDVRGGRSRRRREPQAQLADVPLDGIVSRLRWARLEVSVRPKTKAGAARRVLPRMLKRNADAFTFEQMESKKSLGEL